ncbi:EF-hand domain-containing protein [Stappia indica]|uniref:EF-hand domain-containing protein n=1 Tax=Stappia indica TaxID=538381 RepID=UPI001CD4038C|nr:EF-hand domain-containing protein [Stappia indica]MCA1298422.1 EF-hand domain-containing protein [Stappia indica]
MSNFRKFAVAAVAATLVGSLAVPALADRGGCRGGEGGWHHGMGKGMGSGHHGMGMGRGHQGMAQWFVVRFDTDKDGRVTQAEIDATLVDMFAKADADSSGGVSLEEFKKAYAAEFANRKVRSFQRHDVDGDGKLTKAEFDRRMNRMMDRMEKRGGGKGAGRGPDGMGRMGQMQDFDADGDGNVTREEVEAARAKLFADADKDGDGALTLEEYEAVWVARSDRRMVRMFQRLDRDGNLSVTREEATEPMASIVKRMDRNGDDALSIEDRGRYGKGMRGHHGKRGEGMRGKRGGGDCGNGGQGQGMNRGGNN